MNVRTVNYMGCAKMKKDDISEDVAPPWHHGHASQARFHLVNRHLCK